MEHFGSICLKARSQSACPHTVSLKTLSCERLLRCRLGSKGRLGVYLTMANLAERPWLGRRINFWLKQSRFAHMSSSQTPTLSIIIPALNEAHFIRVTLDAVSRLSGPVELIVVDGGCEDAARE